MESTPRYPWRDPFTAHRKHHQNISKRRHKRNQPHENGRDQLLKRSAREQARVLPPSDGVARNPAPPACSASRPFASACRDRQAEFQPFTCSPLPPAIAPQAGSRTPVLVVIVKPRIEHPCHAKSPCPRHQPKRRQSSLRACQRQVVAGWSFTRRPVAFPPANRRSPSRAARIQVPPPQLLQHFILFLRAPT